MKKVYNIPRRYAQHIEHTLGMPDKTGTVWISIQEPDDDHISSRLDECDNLKLKFWDVSEPLEDIFDPTIIYYPISDKDVYEIFTFLLKHRDKNIIANCAAGVSRSGAISKFCNEYLGHEWDDESKNRSYSHIGPNKYLFSKLEEEFHNYNFLNKEMETENN